MNCLQIYQLQLLLFSAVRIKILKLKISPNDDLQQSVFRLFYYQNHFIFTVESDE